MYRFMVEITSSPAVGSYITSKVFMFAESPQEIHNFIAIMNPYVSATVTQVGDACLGLDQF